MVEPTSCTDPIAYADTTDHLLAELERMTRVLKGYQRTLDSEPTDSAPPVSEGETDPTPTSLALAIPAEARAEVEDHAAAIQASLAETPAATTLRLHHLTEAFNLAPQHRDILVLALLPTAIPAYQSVFAELQNDLAATQPTVGFIADLYSTTTAEFLAATRLLGPESPLRKHDLVRLGQPEDTRIHRTARPVFLEDRIESYILGHDGLDPLLDGGLERVTADTDLDDLRLDPTLRQQLAALPWASDSPSRFYWHGPHGTGKRRAVEAISHGEPFLRADLPAVVEAGALDRLRREAVILDHPLHLNAVSTGTTADPPTGFTIDAVYETFEDFPRSLIVTGTDAWTPTRADTPAIDAIIEFPRPDFAIRRQFWEDHNDVLPNDLDPAVLAGTFDLTQMELSAALATARSLATTELTAEHVYAGCRAQSAGGLADLAEPLTPAATWADIELPQGTMRDLRTVAAHVTHKGRIYHEWAFETRYTRGTGIVALFTGPSGTGKTMAAEIIARDVGMDLYKIDLSSVVSKYIGETEENLERIFTEAEHSNAILLFDEADAVFGDRAAVSDASDRYANVEVNYLLQRIESYSGVVLLTTNYESNIDSAFMRRIDHSVTFRRPDEPTRRSIWDNIFPAETPVSDIDIGFLAGFKLTGGDIRTIAQTAAILAAEDGDTVTMKHVVRGLQRELEKTGTMVDPQEFGPYREFLHLE